MVMHDHVPGHIRTIIADSLNVLHKVGACTCGQVVTIRNYKHWVESNTFTLQWEPEGDWRAPTAQELEALQF